MAAIATRCLLSMRSTRLHGLRKVGHTSGGRGRRALRFLDLCTGKIMMGIAPKMQHLERVKRLSPKPTDRSKNKHLAGVAVVSAS